MPHIHGMVSIDTSVQFGEGCTVWHFAVLCAGVIFGRGCVIGSHVFVGRDCLFGDDVRLQSHVFLPPGTQVGSGVFIGPGVICTDDRYPRVNNPGYEHQPPIIEDGVSIGAGAIILPGVILRQYSHVAAGAVVTHDVPAHGMVMGLPARGRQYASITAHTPQDGQL